MEIKRKLVKAANRLTPEFEVSNSGVELDRIADRINEILDYLEEKKQRSAQRGVSMGVQVAENRRRDAQEIETVQTREEQENLADQEQARAQPDVDNERADRTQESERQPSEEAPAAPKKKRSKKKGRQSKAASKKKAKKKTG